MPFGGLLTAGVLGGTSLLGGLFGSKAATTAAGQQIAAGDKAAGAVQSGTTQANQTLADFYQKNLAQLQPYLNLGGQGVQGLSTALAPGGPLTQGFGAFTGPSPADVASDPGYQFALSQGQKGIEQSGAAKGLSGGTLKDLAEFTTGAAGQQYNNAYERALQSYNTNFNTFNTGQTNLYNRLLGITDTGQQSAGQSANLGQATAQGTSNNFMNMADILANTYTGQGNAQAAGTVGSANAWTGALAGGANTLASLYGNLYKGNYGAKKAPAAQPPLPGTAQYQALQSWG